MAVSERGSEAVLHSVVGSAGRGLSSGGVRPHFLQCKYKVPQNNSTVSLSKIFKHQGLTVLHLLCFKRSWLAGEGKSVGEAKVLTVMLWGLQGAVLLLPKGKALLYLLPFNGN